VNVKWYLKREGMLDLGDDPDLDYYLVLTGPSAQPGRSVQTTRPWQIKAVFLFDAPHLHNEQRRRGVKLGVASSVPAALWDAAEVYPRPTNTVLPLSTAQSDVLRSFATTTSPHRAD
jgi:hypothetical protein